MFRTDKKILSLVLSAALLLSAQPVFAESELIPQDEIVSDNVNYKTATAKYGEYVIETETSGYAFVPEQLNVLYEGDAAKCINTLVKTNDIVEAGDPLFEIEIEVDEIELEEKELRLQRTRTSYQEGLNDYNKEISKAVKDLAEITDSYERQKADLQIQMMRVRKERFIYESEKDIAAQEKALQELYDNKEATYITAPVSGTIYSVSYFSEDDLIRPGNSVAVIADFSSTLVYVASNAFSVGTEVSVSARIQQTEITIPGTVVISSLSIPELASSEGAIYIRLDLSEIIDLSKMSPWQIQELMNIGRTRLDVTGVSTSLKNMLIIPSTAYSTEEDFYYVNILDKDNTLHKRYIKLGGHNKDEAWVLLGLEEGESVIIGK